MNLEFSQLPNDISRIKLEGDLDISGVGTVETRFFAHCSGQPPRVLVDLSGVGFISSLGIRMLLQAIKTVTARSGRMILLNPTKTVGLALDISGLDQFVFSGSEAEAGETLHSSAK
jgi:anti-anti-sigma factor